MFHVGDKVFYPLHGAGIIRKIEQREILGTLKTYYVLAFPLNQMTVMLPMESAEKVGLRQIADSSSVVQVMALLRHPDNTSNENWNQRFRQNTLALKTGNILDLARVVKSLVLRHKEKGLSTNEKKMLDEARNYLTSEIALANNLHVEQATQYIEEAIGL